MNLFLVKNKKSLFIFLITFVICFTIYPNFLFADAGDVNFPDYVGFVNDFADILDSNARSNLETMISKIKSETSSEIAIVTINSLEGLTIEEYAVELFEKWGIGKKDKNNGVLILASMEERAVRIEVGYGLEAVITDLEAGDIIDNIIVPDFKNSNYGTGLYNAVIAISNEIYEEEGLEPIVQEEDLKATQSTTAYSSSTGSRFLQGSFWLLFCCFPVPLFIGLIIFLVNLFKRRCPRCRKFFKLKIKTTILKKATYTSTGNKLIERSCIYCGFKDKKEVTIQKKRRYSSWTGGSGSGHSGGSSSSGGFGGGSSGGGGASGKW